MAKSIRLLNVDVIMNTAGEVIAGESFNTHQADGHSSDASHVMFGGGNTDSLVNTCDMKQFSSTSVAVVHGDFTQARHSLAAASGNA